MVTKIMEMFDADKISIYGSHGFHGIQIKTPPGQCLFLTQHRSQSEKIQDILFGILFGMVGFDKPLP